MFPNTRDLQIANSTLSVAGRDVVVHNNHYHYERSKDIWAILQSIPNFRKIYHDMLSKATPGTGMWLLKGDEFRLWLEPNGDIKIFWGSGIPGAGKTLLASLIIEHIEALRKTSEAAICVCYVYFRYGDSSQMTVRHVLEILVKQILERHPECRALVEQTYEQHLREASEPTEAQLLGLLRELADGMLVTFCVLDALDEAPTKIQLALVKTLASLDVKLFITSRPLKTVEANFPDAHTLVMTAQDSDIDLHIAKGLAENADLQDLIQRAGGWLKEEIVFTIKRNCGGMFLHAALQLDALQDCLSTQDVTDALKVFPSRIEDVYRQTWARISSQSHRHASLAKVVLVWVLYAARSMTVEELERAVAISPETHKFETGRLVPGATLMSLCRGLITIEEESRLIRLVHYTAKDMLEGLLIESFPHPHSLLAVVCMTHLTGCGFQNTTISSWQEFEIALKNDPLLAYASEAWAFHARAGLDVNETRCQIAQFVSQSHAFPALTGPDPTAHLFDILTPLHLIGLYHLPLALIQDTAMHNPNVTTHIYQQSPLIMASESGHIDLVVQLLAMSEIQVNRSDAQGWSALMRAAYLGHEDIVALLLAYPGTQINLVNNNRWSALIWAAHQGHRGNIACLMAHPEIQVNLVINNGWSALIWAARQGYEGVVALLLDHPEVQVNLVTGDKYSALIWAAHQGYEGVVKRLLAHPRIQVNLVTSNGYSALMWAAHQGYEGVVAQLLAHPEIQVDLVNNNGWSALMQAAHHGRKGVVAQLLERREIQVNLVNNSGWSALMQAAHQGHRDVVEQLLAHPEIQVNLVTNAGDTALVWAARQGREGVVVLLLACPQVQVNRFSRDGWTVLIWAARNGHQGVVAHLLAHPEIQVNLVDNLGRSPLMWAALQGHKGIVELLLACSGAHVNLADDHGSTALLLAAECGHTAIVELLLTTGAFDVNAFDKDRDTSIKIAAKQGHEAVVCMLLEVPGVDTTIKSIKDGHTAMSAAQANGHSVIIGLLRDFESRRSDMVSPSKISRLCPWDNADEDASDSDSSESYQDAEEGSDTSPSTYN